MLQIAEAASWRSFKDIMGIDLVNDGSNHISLMILNPKKGERIGLLADFYHKINKLWKKYGGEIIIPRR